MMQKAILLAALLILGGATSAKAGFWDSLTRGDWQQALQSAEEGFNQTMSSIDAEIEKHRARNQTIVVCWASDKTKLAKDPAVLAFEQGPGSHNLEFPFGSDGKLPGSVDVMRMASQGQCDIVSPDASVIGANFDFWAQDKAVEFAASYVIAVIHPELVPLLEQHFGTKINELSFEDLVMLNGKSWGDVGAKGRRAIARIRVHATDVDASASGNVVAAALAYEYAAKREQDPDGLVLREDPEFGNLMRTYFHDVDHSESSTSRLTTKATNDPDGYTIFFTYETKRQEAIDRIRELKGAAPGISYGWASIKADHRMLMVATDAHKRAAAAEFVKYMLTDKVQRIMANTLGFRPVRNVPVGEPLAGYMREFLLTVDPDLSIVRAAYSFRGK